MGRRLTSCMLHSGTNLSTGPLIGYAYRYVDEAQDNLLIDALSKVLSLDPTYSLLIRP